MKNLLRPYIKNKIKIKSRLKQFKFLPEDQYFNEFTFCLLTPQSNAQNCWKAIQELQDIKLNEQNEQKIESILKTKTRFHRTKTKRLLLANQTWRKIKPKLNDNDTMELRNFIAENVNGYGLKEAGHFLRNIGKSNNKVAILDRHILRNLEQLNIIKMPKAINKNNYLEIERKFLDFSNQIQIPIDELDLLFWSQENGEIFK